MMPANPSGDEEDTCPCCGGEGSIEEELSAACNAEEPTIRSYACPECCPFDEPDCDPDDDYRDDFWESDDSEPTEF